MESSCRICRVNTLLLTLSLIILLMLERVHAATQWPSSWAPTFLRQLSVLSLHECPCAGQEAQFLAETARHRRPLLVAIFCFDILAYCIRLGGRALSQGLGALPHLCRLMAPQLINMVLIYTAFYVINRRSRRQIGKPLAALQVCRLLLSLLCMSSALATSVRELFCLTHAATSS